MLKGAIIGFGKIAQNSHLKAYQNDGLKNDVVITSVVEPLEINKEEGKKDHPELNFYSSMDELFANEKINFIDITAPPKFHSQLIQEGIKQNINILCEKPFTLNLEEAKITYALLKNYKKVFMPCHQYRYSPIWKNFKSFLNNNNDDAKSLLQFNVFRPQADPGGTNFDPAWRTDKNVSGGGVLADSGIHYLYLSQWLLGKPKSVTAKIYNLNHGEYPVEDTAIVILEFEKAVAEITLTWGADERVNNARLVSSAGSLNYEGKTQLFKNINGTEEIISVPDASDKAHYFSLYISLIKEFISKINNSQRTEDSIEEAFDSINLLTKCYLSAETGKTILLNDE
ncbi:MAG: Gfo/Idh/MocA family oxidoreductase [Bacteroidetes bacterium]|nr:Gfo/Idh/MocA family oxidoreductase [Bacteroidota bacterium]